VLLGLTGQGSGEDDVYLCYDRRVSEFMGDGAYDSGINSVPHRHPQHRHKLPRSKQGSYHSSFWWSSNVSLGDCATCHHRALNQKKYLDQVDDLYEDFHVIKLPLQLSEVRGVEAIKEFSTMLLEPFDFEKGSVPKSPVETEK